MLFERRLQRFVVTIREVGDVELVDAFGKHTCSVFRLDPPIFYVKTRFRHRSGEPFTKAVTRSDIGVAIPFELELQSPVLTN